MLLNLLLWACDKPIIDSGKPEVVEESSETVDLEEDIPVFQFAKPKSHTNVDGQGWARGRGGRWTSTNRR